MPTSLLSRSLLTGLTCALLAGACGPKAPPEPAVPVPPAVDVRSQMPGPLEVRPFALPETQRELLSNRIPVILAENHEVPIVYVRVVINRGAYTDPADQAGLASVTMDMLNDKLANMQGAVMMGA